MVDQKVYQSLVGVEEQLHYQVKSAAYQRYGEDALESAYLLRDLVEASRLGYVDAERDELTIGEDIRVDEASERENAVLFETSDPLSNHAFGYAELFCYRGVVDHSRSEEFDDAVITIVQIELMMWHGTKSNRLRIPLQRDLHYASGSPSADSRARRSSSRRRATSKRFGTSLP